MGDASLQSEITNCAPVSAQVYGQIAVEQHQVLSHKEAWGTELYQLK